MYIYYSDEELVNDYSAFREALNKPSIRLGEIVFTIRELRAEIERRGLLV
jgi:hypothetical protein